MTLLVTCWMCCAACTVCELLLPFDLPKINCYIGEKTSLLERVMVNIYGKHFCARLFDQNEMTLDRRVVFCGFVTTRDPFHITGI